MKRTLINRINRSAYWGLALLVAMAGIGVMLGAEGARAEPSGTIIPLDVGERIAESSLATADFNGDGYKEIIAAGQDGMVHVVSFNGSTWSRVWSRQTADDLNAAGPPNTTSTTEIRSAPAVADLEGDGSLEIVLTIGGDISHHVNGGVLVYTYDSAWSFSVVNGWPQPKLDLVGADVGASKPDGYWDGIWGAPALGDLDGDGDLEIAVEGFDRRLHSWHHDGTYVAGWPINRNDGDALLRGGWSSPAMGDIDNDGLPEVIFGTDSPEWEGEGGPPPDYSKATVWAINGDSSNVPGFPVSTEQAIQSSPALGDIDGDGELEIVVGTGTGIGDATYTGGYKVYAWNADGSPVNGWPRPTAHNMLAPPALGDLDGDDDLEVVIGCGIGDGTCQWLYAWHGDGTNVGGFPMKPVAFSPWSDFLHDATVSPIMADYDGDNITEIMVVVRGTWGVAIVEPDGTLNPDRSRVTGLGQPSHGWIMASPVVDDVDNDGLLETLVGSVDNSGEHPEITIWDETGTINDALPWPTFHHDMLRTGDVGGGDTTPPTNPSLSSPSHNVSVWSNDNTVQVNWSGATDGESGVRGYHYTWDSSTTTTIDRTAAFVDATTTSITSSPLGDGDTHYFHLRTVDNGGNLAAETVHLGPFWIDTQPPASSASSPEFATGSFAVSWQGSDAGSSGVDSYDVQVRAGASGTWTTWQNDVDASTTQAVYAGTAGNTYSFRSLATDAAGNVETPPAEGDTSTTVTAYSFSGHVFNNQEEAVFGAKVQSSPTVVGAMASDTDGAYELFFNDVDTYQLSVQRTGFGTLPLMSVSGGSVSDLDFYLRPEDDVIKDGNFEIEKGSLAGSAWKFKGDILPTLTDVAHTGSKALLMQGPGTAVVSQTLNLPIRLGADTSILSWMARAAGTVTSKDKLEVQVAIGKYQFNQTVLLADLAAGEWAHGYLSVDRRLSQDVTVHFGLVAGDAVTLRLDEISLGESRPGIERIFLPTVVK